MLDRLKTAALATFTLLRRHAFKLLLALYPFTDQIIGYVTALLPQFGQYLPANIYAAVGIAVVACKVAHDLIGKLLAVANEVTEGIDTPGHL